MNKKIRSAAALFCMFLGACYVGSDGATATEERSGSHEGGVPKLEKPGKIIDGCRNTAKLAGSRVWFHFTRPDDPCVPTTDDKKGYDAHILAELVRLIDSVPSGGRIDGHIYNLSVVEVARALVRAQDRDVKVVISTDGALAKSDDEAKVEYLDALDDIVYCGSAKNRGCVSGHKGSISHSKLFTFSRATTPDGDKMNEVVWFGSANQTYWSGMQTFNNTVTVYGNKDLYGQLRSYLDDLHDERHRTDYYDPDSGRGHIVTDVASIYISPEADSDIVANRLDDITPDENCRVRVMQASVRDNRPEVIDQLVRLRKGGCKVWVVAAEVQKDARKRFKAAGISVRQHDFVHDKSLLVYGRYPEGYRYRVYTGSHNLTKLANKEYDEIFVKLAGEEADHRPVYEAYYTHFNDAYNEGKPL